MHSVFTWFDGGNDICLLEVSGLFLNNLLRAGHQAYLLPASRLLLILFEDS